MAKRLGVEGSFAATTHVINERQAGRLVTIIAEHAGARQPGCGPWSFVLNRTERLLDHPARSASP
jgi:hypothetical protein